MSLRRRRARRTSGSTSAEPRPLGLEPLVSMTAGLQPWRRVFHACSGVLAAAVLAFSGLPGFRIGLLLLALGGVALLLDAVRLRFERVNHLFFRLLRPFASPREARGIASSTWFLLGTGAAALLFPSRVAVPAILVLALADPAASYLGRRWGRIRFGTGTVEGSLTFVLVAVLILVPAAGWIPGLVTALVVAAVERMPWPLDDNLTIPVLAGALLWSLLPLGSPLLP